MDNMLLISVTVATLQSLLTVHVSGCKFVTKLLHTNLKNDVAC